MNERLRELVKQAKLGDAEFGNGVQYYVGTEETFEKFAKLIVQECADIADKAEPYKSNDLIKKHFGVEA